MSATCAPYSLLRFDVFGNIVADTERGTVIIVRAGMPDGTDAAKLFDDAGGDAAVGAVDGARGATAPKLSRSETDASEIRPSQAE